MRDLTEFATFDARGPVGLAAGAGRLICATREGLFDLSMHSAAAIDIAYLSGKLLQLRTVRTWDVVDVLQSLPEGLRPHVNWSTHYDMGVDAVFEHGTQPTPLLTVERVVEAATQALAFAPKYRVGTYQASRLLRVLNQQTFRLDSAALVALIQTFSVQEHALRQSIGEGKSLRAVEQDKEQFELRSASPTWLAAYQAWKRYDVALSRAMGLAKNSELAPREGSHILLRPVWRFHKHWTFASSGPSVPNLPRELRVAFPARPGCFWVQMSLPTPYVRTELAASDFETTDEPVAAFARSRGFDSPEAYEVVLRARQDKALDTRVMEQTNELCCWVAAHALDRFEAGVVLTKGAAVFEMPRLATLAKFVKQLHETLVEPPVVAVWRRRGAMHWQIEAGPTWGAMRVLSADSEFWETELQLL